MTKPECIIEIEALHTRFGNHVVHRDVNLCVYRDEILTLIGGSGSGKTTLLRLIGGQIKPDQGQILFDGVDIPQLKRRELYDIRKRMSMLFQSGALFSGISVFDNVAYPLREHTRLPEEIIRTLVLMKLESVGLRGAAAMMPSQLSGGMARRAALARAIALDPELIMYDEPFAGQDPITMAVLVKLIRELNQSLGITSVIVSHDVAEVMSIADHVYLIANHQIVAQGSPDELRREGNPEVVQFVQGLPDGPVPFHYPAIELLQEL